MGARYEWTDRAVQPEEELAPFVQSPDVHLYTLMLDGWPAGFFQCDFRERGVGALAYFGLVPEAVGQGLGTYLLKTAIHTLWAGPGVARLTVETCTLDHPRHTSRRGATSRSAGPGIGPAGPAPRRPAAPARCGCSSSSCGCRGPARGSGSAIRAGPTTPAS